MAEFGAAHGGAERGGGVVVAGEMVEAVGDVERKFGVDAVVVRAFFDGAVDVNN